MKNNTLMRVFMAVFIAISTYAADTTPTITRAYGPVDGTPRREFIANAMNILQVTNRFPSGARTFITDVRTLDRLAIEDLMTSPTTVNFYRGEFNPPAPWANAHGGTIWWFVKIPAPSGGLISATNIIAEVNGNDVVGVYSNIFHSTWMFSNARHYGTETVGIKADSSRYTEGISVAQPASTLILAFPMPSFTVNNQKDVDDGRGYGSAVPNLEFNLKLTISGVSTNTVVLNEGNPLLTVTKIGNHLILGLEDVGPSVDYTIQRTSSLVGVWETVMVSDNPLTLRPGQSKIGGQFTDSMAFYRYMRP